MPLGMHSAASRAVVLKKCSRFVRAYPSASVLSVIGSLAKMYSGSLEPNHHLDSIEQLQLAD